MKKTDAQQAAFDLFRDLRGERTPTEREVADMLERVAYSAAQQAAQVVVQGVAFDHNELYFLRSEINRHIIEADHERIPRDHPSSTFRQQLLDKLTALLVALNNEALRASGVKLSD